VLYIQFCICRGLKRTCFCSLGLLTKTVGIIACFGYSLTGPEIQVLFYSFAFLSLNIEQTPTINIFFVKDVLFIFNE
jgi:hypothetical protein